MKEQGWLTTDKLNTSYKLNDELEKFTLNFSRCAIRAPAHLFG